MSSHPKDSQPPEDNSSDVQNLSDEDGFMVLDDTHASEQTHPADDEEFWDLDDADESPQISAEILDKGANEVTEELESAENKDFWDLNNQYSSTEAPFAEPEEETTDDEQLAPVEEQVITPSAPISAETTTAEPTPTENGGFKKIPVSGQVQDATTATAVTAAAASTSTPAEVNKTQAPEEKSQHEEDSSASNKSRRSPLEWISSILCYVGIIALFAYLLNYASKQHNFDTDPSYTSNVPVSGEYASIANVETWWEKPTTSGSAKYGVILVPVAKITLSDDSKSGVIRSIFYNPENEDTKRAAVRKGDAITKEFSNGKFVETGTNEITIYATDGFEEEAHYNFYRSQVEERWTIQIREAEGNQVSTAEFKDLAKAPIEAILK